LVLPQTKAAYSPSSNVVNNTFTIVKLLLQQWRYAVPLPADALLEHLQVRLRKRVFNKG